MAFVEVRGLRRIYRTVEAGAALHERVLFDGLDLDIERGEFVAVVGASGCGKSTLLHVLGGLDPAVRSEWAPSTAAGGRTAVVEGTGTVHIDGFPISSARGDARADFVNRTIGFVFQFHHLIPELTALENVVVPALIAGRDWADARREAAAMLERVRLAGTACTRKPAQLSGGERQRVAIARALVNRPALVLADEPTGSLDPTLKTATIDLLGEAARAFAATVVLVTHDRGLLVDATGAPRVDRVLDLEQLCRPEVRP